MFNVKKKIISIILLFAVLAAGASAVFAEDAVTIKKLFNLLPEKALNPTFKDFKLDIKRRDSYIEICDEENRYLSLKSEYGFEMCYWDVKGGKKLILVSYGGTYPELFYLYSKGKISETNDFGIKALKERIKKSPVLGAMDNWICLYPPRQGTSLVVIINQLDCLIFKWKNEKFVCLDSYMAEVVNGGAYTYSTLQEGFVKALNDHDMDACLQYIKPDYIAAQCMDMLDGRVEQFICELIAGQNDKSEYIEPDSLKNIKKASYSLDFDASNANSDFIIIIELTDGRTYTYFPVLEETIVDGQRILHLVGAMG